LSFVAGVSRMMPLRGILVWFRWVDDGREGVMGVVEDDRGLWVMNCAIGALVHTSDGRTASHIS